MDWSECVAAGKSRHVVQRQKPQQIADELRSLILRGELSDGESLGREPDLVERFVVSRPSLREALRILETEGLIRVMRGLRGGVVVQSPNHRIAARTTALVLESRHVSLADVFNARSMLEPLAAKAVASSRKHKSAAAELRVLIDKERASLGDPEDFGRGKAQFHERLVVLAGNQTLGLLIEMLDEIVVRGIMAASHRKNIIKSMATRRRDIRSQGRLIEFIENGEAAKAEEFWRSHMSIIGRVMLGQDSETVIAHSHHQD